MINLSALAQKFDGGGHRFAAGARITDLSTAEIESMIKNNLAEKMPGEFDVN